METLLKRQGKTRSGDGNFKYITIVDVRLGAFRAEVDLVVCDTPADTEFLLNSRIDNDDDGNVSYDDEEF